MLRNVRSGRTLVKPQQPSFLGRDTECRTFRGWLESAKQGTGVAAMLLGSPGIGKSALLRELRRIAAEDGAFVRDLSMSDTLATSAGGVTVVFADGNQGQHSLLSSRAVAFARQVRFYSAVLVVAMDLGDPSVRELARDGVAQLRLGRLTDEEILLLVQRHARASVDAKTLDAIVERAEGNPRHALQLLESWPPRSLKIALDSVMASSGSAGTKAIVALAVATDPSLRIDVNLARFLNAGDAGGVNAGLRTLEQLKLVHDRRFVDELTKTCVENALGKALLTATHARAATWLQSRARTLDGSERLARLARHYRDAEQFREAAVHFGLLGDAHVLEARYDLARDTFIAALHCESRCDGEQTETLQKLAGVYFALGACSLELPVVRKVVGMLDERGDARRVVQALLTLLHRAFLVGDRTTYDDALSRLREIVKKSSTPGQYAGTLLTLAGLAFAEHRPDEGRSLLPVVEQRKASLIPTHRITLHGLQAIDVAINGDMDVPKRARDLYDAALAEGEASDYPNETQYILANYGVFEFNQARTGAAKTALGLALDFSIKKGDVMNALRERTQIAEIAIVEGELRRAEMLITDASFAVAPSEIKALRAWSAARLAMLLRRSDFIAIDEATPLAQESASIGDRERFARAEGAVALLLLAAGETSRLRVSADRIVGAVSHAYDTFDIVALVAPFGSSATIDKARSLLARLAATHDARIAAGMALLFEAEVAAGSGRRQRARRCAGEAVAAFRAIGWRTFLAQALRVSGRSDEAAEVERKIGVAEVRVRVGDGALQQLTVRQRIIAERIAAGARNEDLAVELGIATSTVEKHVGSILRRLGLRSRHEVRSILRLSAAQSEN